MAGPDGIGSITFDSDVFPYLYIGIVHSTVDPEAMGKIEVVVPAVCGDVPLGPCLPLTSIGGGTKDGRGLFSVPPQGAMVGVMFENGDLHCPFYLGGWFPAPGGQTAAPVPSTGKAGDVDKIVWTTEKWVALLIDDGNNKLRIESRDKADLFIELDGGSGEMKLSTGAAQSLLLGGAATEAVVLGNAFLTFFNLHTHPETGVTTGTPTVPMTAAQLSSKVKVAT